MEFVDGRIVVSDSSSGASDEFPTLACGGGHFVAGLKGRQRYYRFTVRAGLKYEIRLQSSNYDPDIFYVFPAASPCTADVIETACMSNGETGTALTWPGGQEPVAFTPRSPGDYIVAVDADWPGAGGPFTLTIFEFCGTSSTTGCKTEACTPSLTGTCNQNVLTICADGTTYAMIDCASDGSTCFSGTCRPTVTDSVGSIGRMAVPTPAGAAGATALNFYSVTKSRTLKQIDQLRYQGSAIPLTWHVFEGTAQAGPYTAILSKTTTSNGVSSGAAESSGPINVRLLAGRYYAIGVTVSGGGAFDVGQELTSPKLPEDTFFGQLTSARIVDGIPASTGLSYVSPGAFVFPQRLTTAL